MATGAKFEYLEYENVVYRRPAGLKGPPAEMNSGQGWVQSSADGSSKARVFGSPLSEEEADEFLAAA